MQMLRRLRSVSSHSALENFFKKFYISLNFFSSCQKVEEKNSLMSTKYGSYANNVTIWIKMCHDMFTKLS